MKKASGRPYGGSKFLPGSEFFCGDWRSIHCRQEMSYTIDIWPRRTNVQSVRRWIPGGIPCWKCIWALASEEVVEHIAVSQEPKAKDWIFTLIDKLPHHELTEVFITFWAIWHAQRKVIHENIFQSPLFTCCFTESCMAELQVLHEKRTTSVTRLAVATAPAWIPLPPGWAKINVDTALGKNDNKGAVAPVTRSCNGMFAGASSIVFEGIQDPETLEALACREALALASDLHIHRVKAASNCLQVINTLHEGSRCSYVQRRRSKQEAQSLRMPSFAMKGEVQIKRLIG